MIPYIIGGIIVFLIIAIILIAYICYLMAFHVKKKDKYSKEDVKYDKLKITQ